MVKTFIVSHFHIFGKNQTVFINGMKMDDGSKNKRLQTWRAGNDLLIKVRRAMCIWPFLCGSNQALDYDFKWHLALNTLKNFAVQIR